MCNAWNHPSSCICGWGGIGHLGRRGPGTYTREYWWVPPITQTYESYVNPNALCPVCGASVFFYQSPDGGKVFFDELGPPWPKHPCTNSSSIPKQTSTFTSLDALASKNSTYKWQKKGWKPFFITAVSEIDKYFLKIRGILDGENLTLYVRRVVPPYVNTRGGKHNGKRVKNYAKKRSKSTINPIMKENIAHVQKLTECKYKLSLITIFVKTITRNSYTLLSEARRK